MANWSLGIDSLYWSFLYTKALLRPSLPGDKMIYDLWNSFIFFLFYDLTVLFSYTGLKTTNLELDESLLRDDLDSIIASDVVSSNRFLLTFYDDLYL